MSLSKNINTKIIDGTEVKYTSFSKDTLYIIGKVTLQNIEMPFDINEKSISFFFPPINGEVDKKNLRRLVESNENFARENNCSKVFYRFEPDYIPLCSRGGIENNNKTIKDFLKFNGNYDLIEYGKNFPSSAIKELK